MTTWIALLRGVNVGTARRVPMARWRSMLEAMGGLHVRTLLNSGNAVFRSAGGTARQWSDTIAEALADELGVQAPVIVTSDVELAAIVKDNPWADDLPDPSRLLVVFAPDAAALQRLAPIGTLAVPPDRFAIGSRAAYLRCGTGLLDSPAAAALLGKAGQAVTTRNWRTTLKLLELARSLPA